MTSEDARQLVVSRLDQVDQAIRAVTDNLGDDAAGIVVRWFDVASQAGIATGLIATLRSCGYKLEPDLRARLGSIDESLAVMGAEIRKRAAEAYGR